MTSPLRVLTGALMLMAATAAGVNGQAMSVADMSAMEAHMQMTKTRPRDAADSLRAAKLVTELRSSIGKYKDVRLAVDDGFRQFAP